METYNWSKFTKRISIKESRETIFDYWLSQENLEKWFLSKAQFYTSENEARDRNEKICQGDSYKWMWHGSDIVSEGEILDLSTSFLKFTFSDCDVTVRVLLNEGENLIELTQSRIALDESSRMNIYVGCTEGWTFYLANLKSILEGGIDLRNKNIKLQNVINT